MPTEKKQTKAPNKNNPEEGTSLQALEERVHTLEEKLENIQTAQSTAYNKAACELWEKANAKTKEILKEANFPNKNELRTFIAENPFLALAIAVLGTVLIISIF